MLATSKAQLFQNIYVLAKRNNIKIGDVEKVAGVSSGYFSRVIKHSSKATLSIEALVEIANLFETSVDALLFSDVSSLDSGEMYLLNFISKLTELTEGNKICWRALKTTYLGTEAVRISESTRDNPLFDMHLKRALTFGYLEEVNITYMSRFYPGYIAHPVEYIFSAVVEDFGELYFTMSNIAKDNTDNINDIVYELYIIDRSKETVTPVCCTSFREVKIQKLDFDVFLPRLYEIIKRRIENPDIDEHLFKLINKFNNKFSLSE